MGVAARRMKKHGPLVLGDLSTHGDAKRWLAMVGPAVASDQLDPKLAHPIIRAVEV